MPLASVSEGRFGLPNAASAFLTAAAPKNILLVKYFLDTSSMKHFHRQ
jgi:hypothetical protein